MTVTSAANHSGATPGKAFREGFVDSAGFRLRYAAAGPEDGPVLISLPGSAGLEMSVAKDRLGEAFRVIEINPPGWGDSPEVLRPMEQQELGQILGKAAIGLAGKPFHLLGTSMGGGNAAWLAVEFPGEVLSLTLEGSMAPVRESDLTVALIRREVIREMLKGGGPPGGYPTPPPSPGKPWATPDYILHQMEMRFRMMQWVQTDIGGEELLSAVRRSQIPILALMGDEDPLIKPSVAEHYAKVLPKARFVLVPGGEHDLQNSQPDIFVREVTAFLNAHAIGA